MFFTGKLTASINLLWDAFKDLANRVDGLEGDITDPDIPLITKTLEDLTFIQQDASISLMDLHSRYAEMHVEILALVEAITVLNQRLGNVEEVLNADYIGGIPYVMDEKPE